MSKHKFSHRIDKNPGKLPTVGIVRYGAVGDCAQAASVCAAYKKAGYYVTFYGTFPSTEILHNNPNIDEIVTMLQDQVPMDQLGFLWIYQRKLHDKWVNLTESVESNLLATLGNIRFEWDPRARHRHMNINYLEFQHLVAGIPYEPSYEFYPTDDEMKWADKEREKMRKAGIQKFVIWGLAGSSRTHKVWPHAYEIWRRLYFHYKEWGIVAVGDASCAELDKGFEGEPRHWSTSGKWTMRQVLTMMQMANVVLGPETGLMSCAAFYPMPKILLLSHSTVENLSRDWVNTTSLWAPETHCPGRGANLVPACHMMQNTFEPGCRRHEEANVAQCCWETKPEWVWDHLQRAMNEGAGGTFVPPGIGLVTSGD